MGDLYCVILAGGSGTRFWPASRKARPKQFLAVTSDLPMIAATRERVAGWVPDERVLVLTGRAYVDLVREALPGLPPENVLAEPEARNTAPCLAWAASEIHRRDPGSVQVVLAADHAIEPVSAFRETLERAVRTAERDPVLVTFGIEPTYPATGFGYIEAAPVEGDAADAGAARPVARFLEKPSEDRARELLARGGVYWNSGMFVWSTAAIRAALAEFLPEVLTAFDGARTEAAVADAFAAAPAVSIDVGVMERARNVRVLPADFEWNDVGSWPAMRALLSADADGNCANADARLLAEDSSGCTVFSEAGTVTALVGVRDLIVVQAGGATLVCPRDRAEEVKRIVERLGHEAPDWL